MSEYSHDQFKAEVQALLRDFRQALTAVNFITEKKEDQRTEEEKKILRDAQTFIYENTPELIEHLVESAFRSIDFVEEPWARWETVLVDPECKPPLINVGLNINEEILDITYKKLYSGHNTVAGCYEEAAGYEAEWEKATKESKERLRAICGFDKLDKANTMFTALMPIEVSQKINRVAYYAERLKRRVQQYEKALDIVIQLKHVNLGTPNNPKRIWDDEPREGFRRGSEGVDLPKKRRGQHAPA